jgi:uncharacterized protein
VASNVRLAGRRWTKPARRADIVGMTRALALLAIVAASCAPGPPRDGRSEPQPESLCSASWYRSIEEKVPTTDDLGHGPDVGSDEWKSVVELRLGIRDDPTVPRRDDAWCRHIDRLVREQAWSPSQAGAAAAPGPSFDCEKVESGTIEKTICADAELAALDRRLSDVYAAATGKAPVLEAEQRAWAKGRDECRKKNDRRGCVRDEYRRRIAELQARYRLVSGIGPFVFACDGDARNEIAVTFFETDPPTAIAERGDGVSLMYRQPSASGAKYEGRNESFWERGGEATIVWGQGAAPMRCVKAP